MPFRKWSRTFFPQRGQMGAIDTVKYRPNTTKNAKIRKVQFYSGFVNFQRFSYQTKATQPLEILLTTSKVYVKSCDPDCKILHILVSFNGIVVLSVGFVSEHKASRGEPRILPQVNKFLIGS